MAFTHSKPMTSTQSQDADVGAYNAYAFLHTGYVAMPIVVGIDKFTNWLTPWDRYLAPIVSDTLNIAPRFFMSMVGVVEILAGLLVAMKPRIGAYVVAAWLAGIIVNLLMNPVPYWDVAIRDFGLMLGALALGSLSGWTKRHS